MSEYKLESIDKNSFSLHLSGQIDIIHAESIKDSLLSALKEGKNLVIDLEKIEGIDLAGLQLLCAAEKTAKAAKKKLTLNKKIPQCFTNTLLESGFFRDKKNTSEKTDECFWLSEWVNR